ncbi:type IV pilus secretin PilQ [Tolumonas osonensis]|uniref:Type IV pilus assembly protein PilQ n=1 Tax=Tolumonas osonensis TaxID=675874 RepID=A0A841GBB6_9GAMM|nr:type IV pilus secretin PilQ family protein [Tolumonas osonensis]MBB6055219.1 type IV pilus assembly protein PilQ [Tolumonas osonensis]
MSTNRLFTSGLYTAAVLSFAAYSTTVFALTELENIRVSPLSGDQLELQFDFNEPVTTFTDKLKYQPNQLYLNFPATSSALKQNTIPIERLGIQEIQVKPKNAGLDVSVNLERLMPYRIKQDGTHISVTLGQSLANEAKAQSASDSKLLAPQTENVTAGSSAMKSNAGVINNIEHVDFRRGKNGQGQLLINLQNSAAAVEVTSRGNHVIASFNATGIRPDLIALMNVNDFNTPVSSIDVQQNKSNVTFDLNIKGRFDYKYDQSGSLFIVEVSPPLKTASANAPKKYKGKPISLNFQDVPVRTVLQLIADFNKLNLVTTDSVGGNITLRLDGVPWEQALDTVLKVKGLDKRLDNNILLVAPAAEIAAQEKQQLENKQKVADLAPLVTEYVQINYAKAPDMAKLLADDKTRLLSPRGAVSVDERTNTLLVKDTAEVIDHIKDMIKVLDVAVKQVVIEARMVTVTDGVEDALGIRWGVTETGSSGGTSGSLEGLDSAGTPPNMTTPAIDDRLNVNLAAAPSSGTAASIAFQVAKLADGSLLDLELSALENENKAEIISSPRVTTANQKEALIEQGYEIPYNESSSSGATTVEFKKAVLSLKVTPQITPDNNVILDLHVTQDDIYQDVNTGSGGTAKALSTQAISTQVLVKNGETLVLGGIYNRSIKKTVNKVPVLGDIPGLGVLFRNTTNSNTKKELLIFVTPKIVTGNL